MRENDHPPFGELMSMTWSTARNTKPGTECVYFHHYGCRNKSEDGDYMCLECRSGKKKAPTEAEACTRRVQRGIPSD